MLIIFKRAYTYYAEPLWYVHKNVKQHIWYYFQYSFATYSSQAYKIPGVNMRSCNEIQMYVISSQHIAIFLF